MVIIENLFAKNLSYASKKLYQHYFEAENNIIQNVHPSKLKVHTATDSYIIISIKLKTYEKMCFYMQSDDNTLLFAFSFDDRVDINHTSTQ